MPSIVPTVPMIDGVRTPPEAPNKDSKVEIAIHIMDTVNGVRVESGDEGASALGGAGVDGGDMDGAGKIIEE